MTNLPEKTTKIGLGYRTGVPGLQLGEARIGVGALLDGSAFFDGTRRLAVSGYPVRFCRRGDLYMGGDGMRLAGVRGAGLVEVVAFDWNGDRMAPLSCVPGTARWISGWCPPGAPSGSKSLPAGAGCSMPTAVCFGGFGGAVRPGWSTCLTSIRRLRVPASNRCSAGTTCRRVESLSRNYALTRRNSPPALLSPGWFKYVSGAVRLVG